MQVGSALAYRSIPLQSAYCAAKHALLGFTDSLRSELIHDGSSVHLTMVHLPALNTPQFTWSKARLPHEPQPVRHRSSSRRWRPRRSTTRRTTGAARSGWAADGAGHRRRTSWRPGSATDTWRGPAARRSRPTSPSRPDRRDNLYEPVPGDHGAHGPFDERATDRSFELWATKHRNWLLAAGGVAAAGLVAAMTGEVTAGAGRAAGRAGLRERRGPETD